MRRFRFLRVSKTLLLCNIDYDGSEIVQSGMFRGPVAVGVFVCCAIYFFSRLYHDLSSTFVEMYSYLGNVAVTYLTVLFVVVEHFVRRNRMFNLGKLMLDYVKDRDDHSKEESQFDVGKFMIRAQIGIVVVSSTLLSVVKFRINMSYFSFWECLVILVLSLSFVYALGNLIFIQFFTHFICWEMQQLTLNLRCAPIQRSINCFDQLIVIKRYLGVTLGVRLLLTLFQLIVNVSYSSYIPLLYMPERQLAENLDTLHTLATMLLNNTLVLFGVTYSFDRVQTEVGTNYDDVPLLCLDPICMPSSKPAQQPLSVPSQQSP